MPVGNVVLLRVDVRSPPHIAPDLESFFSPSRRNSLTEKKGVRFRVLRWKLRFFELELLSSMQWVIHSYSWSWNAVFVSLLLDEFYEHELGCVSSMPSALRCGGDVSVLVWNQ